VENALAAMPDTVEMGLERRLKEKYDKSWTAATASYHQTVSDLVRLAFVWLAVKMVRILSFVRLCEVVVVKLFYTFSHQTARFQSAESNLEQAQTEHRMYKVWHRRLVGFRLSENNMMSSPIHSQHSNSQIRRIGITGACTCCLTATTRTIEPSTRITGRSSGC
jgi:hypothetical protein